MTDVVIPSTSRPVSAEVLKGAIRNAGFGDWIVPTSEDHYASEVGLAGTPLNAFNVIAGDSLTVTIDTGEAYVDGAWLGRDEQTDLTLDASTTTEIAVGPQYQASDAVRIDELSAFAAEENPTVIWEITTDASSVTSASRIEHTSPPFEGSDGRLAINRELEATDVADRLTIRGEHTQLQLVETDTGTAWNTEVSSGNYNIFGTDNDGHLRVLSSGNAALPNGTIQNSRGSAMVTSGGGAATVHIYRSSREPEPDDGQENDIWIQY